VPVDRDALVESLHTLLAAVDLPDRADDRVLSQRLDRVMASATQVLQVDGVGLMLLDEHDVLRVAGASDEVSAALERGQQSLGEGPGIDCVRSGRTVTVDDLSSAAPYEAVWQRLLRSADGDGSAEADGSAGAHVVHAVLSVPVRVRGEIVGTLNALRLAPMGWSTEHVRAVEAYAGIVGVLIRLGSRERRPAFDALRASDE
jgi:GAF domain-containing protein